VLFIYYYRKMRKICLHDIWYKKTSFKMSKLFFLNEVKLEILSYIAVFTIEKKNLILIKIYNTLYSIFIIYQN